MNFTDKRILVTGGAGFIGSHLVETLRGNHVTVLDDFSTGREENLAPIADQRQRELDVVRGDVRDRTLVNDLMRGIEVVFHLACRGVRHSIGHPRESHEVNAAGTLNVLEAARAAGTQRFVHVSSSEVYGTARYVPMDEAHPCFPETVYGAAKLAGEAYARAFHQTYGLPTTVVRPFNNFGPRSHFEGDCGEVIPRFCIWALNGRPPIIFGDGAQTRDFIFVRETAAWLVQIAACTDLIGKTLNLGSGQETSVLELARIVWSEAGSGAFAPEFRCPRPGDVRRHCADARYACRTIGFQVQADIRRGIRDTLAYFRALQKSPQPLLPQIDDENWSLAATGRSGS